MKLIDRIHNFSLHALTWCGVGAVVSVAVNLTTALVMAIADRARKD